MLRIIFYIALFFCSTLTYGQGSADTTENPDSSYRCAGCDHYLFSEKEIIKKEGDQHYHVSSGNDTEKTTIYCAACNKHIGFFDKNKSEYQIFHNHIEKSEKDSKYHCKGCNASIFGEKHLLRKDDQYGYFSDPVEGKKISKQFYKTDASKVLCAKCNVYLGEVNNSNSERFGVRIKLGSILKKQ